MTIKKIIYSITLAVTLGFFLINPNTEAQKMTSTNYDILEPTLDAGAGVTESANYGLLITVDPTAFAKLESTNYKINSGVPSTFQASVPEINCFETTTDSGSSTCSYVGANGMQGVCGEPGCHDRAKIEIDDQNNPYDTLYLVRIIDDDTSTTYYLQSDYSISTSFDINDFLDQCDLEGIDPDEPTCDTGEGREDTDLQKSNIIGLRSNTQYTVDVIALHGDYTGSGFSPTATATTEDVTLVLDLDVAIADTETAAPYSIDLGALTSVATSTPAESIWIDLGTNNAGGINLYVTDLQDGLYQSATTTTIPSETEDIDDGGNTNGGYGLKTLSVSESALGPLKNSGTIYVTAGSNEVGKLDSTVNELILYTNTTGGTYGQINEGRGKIAVKAKSSTTNPSGTYVDTIIFYCSTNI